MKTKKNKFSWDTCALWSGIKKLFLKKYNAWKIKEKNTQIMLV